MRGFSVSCPARLRARRLSPMDLYRKKVVSTRALMGSESVRKLTRNAPTHRPVNAQWRTTPAYKAESSD